MRKSLLFSLAALNLMVGLAPVAHADEGAPVESPPPQIQDDGLPQQSPNNTTVNITIQNNTYIFKGQEDTYLVPGTGGIPTDFNCSRCIVRFFEGLATIVAIDRGNNGYNLWQGPADYVQEVVQSVQSNSGLCARVTYQQPPVAQPYVEQAPAFVPYIPQPGYVPRYYPWQNEGPRFERRRFDEPHFVQPRFEPRRYEQPRYIQPRFEQPPRFIQPNGPNPRWNRNPGVIYPPNRPVRR